MILLVKNIQHKVNEMELEHLFYSFGEVIETNLIYDPVTWQPKGFAFVEMKNKTEALQAMQNLNGVKMNGKPLVIKRAHVVQHH